MKKKLTILCLLAVTSLTLSAQDIDPCSQTTKLSSPVRTITSNGMGNLSGSGVTQIHYEMWTDAGGSASNKLEWYGANVGGGAAFRAEWDRPDDFLGRVGFYWGNGQQYTAYKNIYCDFNYTRSANGTGGGYSYIGIYGWGRNPSAPQDNRKLVEYYIIDDWYSAGQLGTATTGGTKVGEYTLDGGTYHVITSIRTQKPSIDGTKTFTQYFSIRQGMTSSRRQCGTISVTEHFKEWEKLGLHLGNLYECKFLAEAGGGTGWFDASYLKFSQEDQLRGSGYSLTTTASPSTGGRITKNPDNAGYTPNTTVQLIPQAADGWKFDRWSGDVTGNLSPLTITMDANKSITAKFVPTVNGTENLVKNGDFVNNQNWTLNTGSNYGGSAGTFSVSGGKATINITGTGTNPWEPQLVQQGISLEQDMKYRLTFDASVAEARDLEVLLQMAGSPYTTYLSTGTIALTNQTQSFSFEFEMTHPSDPNAQLAFNVGQSTQNVILSNIKLIYLADFTKTVTLTFDSQGGSTVTPGSITVEAGATIGTLPAEPHLAGYSFNGWYSLPDGNGTQYTASSTLTEDTVAYAMWTADIYTIEYDAEGGDAVPGGTYTIESDDIILPTATRRGYDFAGWQEPGSLTMETIIPTGSIGNRFYSAQWKVIEYDIIYVLDGGDNHPENPASYTVEDNIVLQDPVKENFEFTGWEEGNEIPEGSIGEKTFTATWASLTHISENASALAFQIYPNPVTGNSFDIILTDSETAVCSILTMQGQILFNTVINKGVTSISTALETGVYVVSIQCENGLTTQKLIIK
jgi:endo-1,4-beta-xylanase